MEGERHGIGPNGVLKRSLEDQCTLSVNTSSATSNINVVNQFTTNDTNSNNNNCTSNNNKGQNRFLSNGDGSSSNNNNSNNKEQDRFLPIANVGRIMKKVIPGNGKISKDAKETVQECVSEFISFVTGEASDKCQREKRKTINGDDIIWAITTLGFEDYVTPLKQYLNRYRELEGEKLNVPKRQRLQNDQKPNVSYSSVYSSPNLLSDAPFVTADQAFSLPFVPNSVPQQLPTHEHVDSLGQWES